MRITSKALRAVTIAATSLGFASFLNAGHANAAANCLTDITSVADFALNGNTCTIRGVTISNFSKGQLKDDDAVNFSATPHPTANVFTFNVQSASPFFNTLNTGWTYTISHASKKFLDVTNALTSSRNGGNNSGDFTLVSSAGTNLATYRPTNTSVGATNNYLSQIFTDNITNDVDVTLGEITQVTTTYTFGDPTPPPSGVPGPLPLLGAGAAFGYSRKIRRRLNAA